MKNDVQLLLDAALAAAKKLYATPKVDQEVS